MWLNQGSCALGLFSTSYRQKWKTWITQRSLRSVWLVYVYECCHVTQEHVYPTLTNRLFLRLPWEKIKYRSRGRKAYFSGDTCSHLQYKFLLFTWTNIKWTRENICLLACRDYGPFYPAASLGRDRSVILECKERRGGGKSKEGGGGNEERGREKWREEGRRREGKRRIWISFFQLQWREEEKMCPWLSAMGSPTLF